MLTVEDEVVKEREEHHKLAAQELEGRGELQTHLVHAVQSERKDGTKSPPPHSHSSDRHGL